MKTCFHSTTTWPRRHQDGLDYIRCLECGDYILSPIQFSNTTSETDKFFCIGDINTENIVAFCILTLMMLAPAILWWFS